MKHRITDIARIDVFYPFRDMFIGHVGTFDTRTCISPNAPPYVSGFRSGYFHFDDPIPMWGETRFFASIKCELIPEEEEGEACEN